jgi:hypothetical protein
MEEVGSSELLGYRVVILIGMVVYLDLFSLIMVNRSGYHHRWYLIKAMPNVHVATVNTRASWRAVPKQRYFQSLFVSEKGELGLRSFRTYLG